MNDIAKIAERFYAGLYACNAGSQRGIETTSLVGQVSRVIKQEVEKSLKAMKPGKAAGNDGITADLVKLGADVILQKLAELFLE